jgi:hypothetical protein
MFQKGTTGKRVKEHTDFVWKLPNSFGPSTCLQTGERKETVLSVFARYIFETELKISEDVWDALPLSVAVDDNFLTQFPLNSV